MRTFTFIVALALISSCDRPSPSPAEIDARNRAYERAGRLAAGWTYSDPEDEVQGEIIRSASVRAENWSLIAPELLAMKRSNGIVDLAVRGSLEDSAAPQMRCSGAVNVKFDEGQFQRIRCQGDNAVTLDPAILPALRRSKTMWLQIGTTASTAEQYKFNIANLAL